MAEWMIHTIAVFGIIASVISIGAWIRMEKAERKVDSFQFRMKELEWKLSENIDLTSKLQQELWASKKPAVSIGVEMGESVKILEEITQSMRSMGKVLHPKRINLEREFPAIDYAHEIEVAMRFLSTRLTDTKIPKKWDSSFHLGAIGWAEVEPVLKQAQRGKLVEWIEKEYNPQCKPYVQINTRKEVDRV